MQPELLPGGQRHPSLPWWRGRYTSTPSYIRKPFADFGACLPVFRGPSLSGVCGRWHTEALASSDVRKQLTGGGGHVPVVSGSGGGEAGTSPWVLKFSATHHPHHPRGCGPTSVRPISSHATWFA